MSGGSKKEFSAQVKAVAHEKELDAAIFVDEYVREHGTGPTWLETARAIGVSRELQHRVIERLVANGWLTASREPRSLRPGPAATGGRRSERSK